MKFPSINLLVVTIMIVLGIFVFNLSTFSLKILFYVNSTILLIGIIFSLIPYFRTKFIFSITCLFFFFMGGLLITQEKTIPDNHYKNYLNVEKQNYYIYLKDSLSPSISHYRYYGIVFKVNEKNTKGKILVLIEKKSLKTKIKEGSLIVSWQHPKIIQKPKNPGEFNFKKYMIYKKVYYQVYLKSNQFLPIGNNKNKMSFLLKKIKNTISSSIINTNLTESSVELLKTLLLGEKKSLDTDLKKAYAKAGVIHLLAISGLHIAILLLFFNKIFTFISYLKNGKGIKQIVILIILWGFALLTGMSASVVRAVTMFSILSFSLIIRKPNNVIQLLFLSFLFLIIIQPFYIFNVGFQLSYLALIGIIFLHPKISKIWQPKNIFLKRFWEITTVTLAAQIFVAPLSIYYFNQFPGLFLLANWIILPFFGLFLIISVLIIIISATGFFPKLLGIIYNNIVETLNNIVLKIASQEKFLFENIFIDKIETTIFYIVLFLITIAIHNRHFKNLKNIFFGALILQSYWTFLLWKKMNENKLWILHDYKKSIIVHQYKGTASFFSNIMLNKKDAKVKNYSNFKNPNSYNFYLLQNTFTFKEVQLLIIDQKGIFKIKQFSPNYILLRNNPEINLERVLDLLQPKYIIADGTNAPWNIEIWKKECEKRNISFHSTQTKGALAINF